MTIAATEASPAEPAAATGSLPPTVLTVDDEPSILSALRRLFRTQGYKTLQATSGAEGLALLEQHEVDLVISDMRMPEMDGARFLAQVRTKHPSVVRILMTGYADISSTIAAINEGEIHRYIAKPWDDQALQLAVREALSRRDLERSHAALTELTRTQNEQLRVANQTLESRVASRTAEIQQIHAMLETSFEELDRTFLLTVNVFSGLLEMREGNAGHARRVAELARLTALRLGLGERAVRDVHLAALLHDVGKMRFPDSMLGKPVSNYTPDEVSRYHRHPVDGETALMPLAQLQGAAAIVRQHHERFDGKGFPDGLAGAEISVGAGIVAAASDLDGMLYGTLSDERYTPERARQMMMGGVDKRYRRDVVEALMLAVADAGQSAAVDTEIDVRDLQPGMVLARDLVSPRGAILLAAGYVFDDRIIRQVCEFAKRESLRLLLRVRNDSKAAADLNAIFQSPKP